MSDAILSELNNADLDWLLEISDRHTLKSGGCLPSSPGAIDLVLDGMVEVYAAQGGPDGQDHPVIDQLGSGDMVGEHHLFSQCDPPHPKQYAVVADATVLAVPVTELMARLTARFYRAIALILSEQLRRIYQTPTAVQLAEKQPLRDALLVFSELRDSDLDWLVQTGQVERFATDEFLLRAGRPVDALHIILDGLFSVGVLEGNPNPLMICFNCPVETASAMTVVNTLTKGEIAGAIAFLDARPLPVSIRALRESLVLTIPRQQFTVKLQQDRGFAATFYRILGSQLAGMVQTAILRSPGQSQAPAVTDDSSDGLSAAMADADKLDLDALQHLSDGANRFTWMLSRLGVGV